ncbi:hypothetical protein DFH08DRAFT_964130 [Mycena albidolilacea]|uniref:Uncharacterized protein n=1 Tax=Mycena albidolilacea TaxID=1033008 RepID=A0AAD7ENT0_9AGAR|nr:hypothetical protein DFH08DRAFT_964130 [Mycena albidolilacea]
MFSDKSFDDMLEMPLDSSPLKPPSPSTAVRTVPSAPASPSPTGSFLPVLAQKRVAEDLTQYANGVSRAHKLLKTDQEELTRFAKADRGQQLVFIAGQLLALNHHQWQIQPAEAAWTPHKKLSDKIEGNARILFADPSLPAYKDDKFGPNKLLMDMVLAHGWGFTMEMQDDRGTMDALGSHIGRVSISKRNTIKGVIATSLGSAPVEGEKLRPGALNIVELATKILQKLHVNAKVDLPFCGRVAILRKLISESTDSKYWGAVDTKLSNLRRSHPDPAKQSKFIKRLILDPDLEMFGTVELTSLASTTGVMAVPVAGPSRVRRSAESDGDDKEV